MKFTTTILLLLFSISAYTQYAYSAAENGLRIRQQPDILSAITGTLAFGEKVQILEKTDHLLSIVDNDTKIVAKWFKIVATKNSSLTGYVFSGYLTSDNILQKSVQHLNGYTVTITTSSKEAFEQPKKARLTTTVLDKEACLEQGLIDSLENKEIKIRLSNQTEMVLKKEVFDEQFFGYTFLHFAPEQNLYFFWENWLEAGHPILVNAHTGKITEVVGSQYVINPKGNIMALYGKDMDSGWTPNGIQLFALGEKTLKPLFTINRDLSWGPIEIAWENDATLLIACEMRSVGFSNFTTYKKLQFQKK